MKKKAQAKRVSQFPEGWDEARCQGVIDHYENTSDEDLAAEDDAAFKEEGQTVMVIPTSIVERVRAIIAKEAAKRKRAKAA